MPGNVDTIQAIIDNAAAGDTILFKGETYTHLFLTIDKTLNIISEVGTKLSSCPSNADKPIFSILEGGSGTNISGFNISARDVGILIEDAVNVTIEDNIIKATGTAVEVINSANITIDNNTITGSNLGINISSSNNTKISNSTITNNGEGIKYSGNTNNTEISNNNVSNNNGYGIAFEGSEGWMQDNVQILYNYISNNLNSGIYINSSYISFEILSNMITSNGKGYDLGNGNGNGIYMDSGTNTSVDPIVLYNYILNNNGFNNFQIQRVQTDDNNRAILNVGYNFYAASSKGLAGLCAKTKTGLILSELSEVSKGIYQVRYKTNDTGVTVTQMIDHYVKVYFNGEAKDVLVKNGVGRIDLREATYKSTGNEIYTYYKSKDSLSISDKNIPQKAISIASKISSSSIKNGQTTKYTITVSNIGEKIIKSLNIKDIIPNLNIASFSSNIGSFNKNTKVWTINQLKAGEKAVLNVNLKANKAGTYKNTATLTGDGFNKKSSLTTLKVTEAVNLKYANKAVTKVKKNRFTILSTTIKNYGSKPSSYLTVKMKTSSGLKASQVSHKKNFNKKTKEWKVKIPAKKTVTLKMKVKATKKGKQGVSFSINNKKQNKYMKVV